MRLQVSVDLGVTGEIVNFYYQNTEENNVSNQPVNTGSTGYKGFQLSDGGEGFFGHYTNLNTPLDGSYKLFPESGYPGWMSSRQTASDGSIVGNIISLNLTFNRKVDYVYIIFDKELNEYPTYLSVSGSDYAHRFMNHEGPTLLLTGLKSTTLSVGIYKWNKPYTSVKVSQIVVDGFTVFKGNEVESVECSEQAWGSSFQLSTGFIQQYADIVFRDKKQILQQLADAGALTSFMPIKIEVVYKQNGTTYTENLGTYISDTWSVDKTENKVTVSCNDYTRNFENYVIDVIAENISIRQLFEKISEAIPETDIVPKTDSSIVNPLTGEEITVEAFLDSCVSADSYFQNVAASSIIEEICDRWLLKVYWRPKEKRYVIMEAW